MRRVLTRRADGQIQTLWISDGVQMIALETDGACKALSVSEYTLRKWVREGRIHPRDCGNKKLWLVEELIECAKGLPYWYKWDDQENQEVNP